MTARDATRAFAAHAVDLAHADLPEGAVRAAKTFLLDTLGVGIAGARAPFADQVLAVAGLGPGAGAPVLGRGTAVAPPAAAFANAYQIHAQEFDCVHEGAVVHPLATVLGALMADVARLPGPVDGRRFLTALVAAVDVAAGLGLAARSPLKFFRPATAGIFGCVAGMAALRGLDEATAVGAFGHALAFIFGCVAGMAALRGLDEATAVGAFGHALAFASGTMQAHVEGKPGLPLQIANAARNSLTAIDLAVAGVPGVAAALDGPFGYLPLFEDGHEIGPVLAGLGTAFRIAEVSHKPFPTGRAAHGAIVATRALVREHGVTADNLDRLTYTAPPLIHRLVGRPVRPDLTANYARLCFPYLGAVTLLRGTVGLADFTAGALADPAVQALAARIAVVADGNPDPAAFTPAVAEADLADGRRVRVEVAAQLGSPALPLTREEHLAKFRGCLDFAGVAAELGGMLIRRVDALEDEPDMAALFRAAAGLE